MLTFSILTWIEALFANVESSMWLRQRDATLQQVIQLVKAAGKNQTFSDFSDSIVHQSHHMDKGLFKEPWDIAFTLSTDGAQLTFKKQSNHHGIVIIQLLSMPGDSRYKSDAYWIPLATPGPNAPGDIESFLWPVFADLAKLVKGFGCGMLQSLHILCFKVICVWCLEIC